MKVFPVVHVTSVAQAVEQSELAMSLGADGVFLIDHGTVGRDGLFESFNAVAAAVHAATVGINLLSGGPVRDFRTLDEALVRGHLDRAPDAVWCDDARADGDLAELPGLRTRLAGGGSPLAKSVLYGGVAFKYTPTFTEDPATAVEELEALQAFIEVPTTSGLGTGKAPNPAKVAAMKKRLGTVPLAVASGISVENIANYVGSVDHVLVASSVETEPYSGIFDAEELKRFIRAAHSADANGAKDE